MTATVDSNGVDDVNNLNDATGEILEAKLRMLSSVLKDSNKLFSNLTQISKFHTKNSQTDRIFLRSELEERVNTKFKNVCSELKNLLNKSNDLCVKVEDMKRNCSDMEEANHKAVDEAKILSEKFKDLNDSESEIKTNECKVAKFMSEFMLTPDQESLLMKADAIVDATYFKTVLNLFEIEKNWASKSIDNRNSLQFDQEVINNRKDCSTTMVASSFNFVSHLGTIKRCVTDRLYIWLLDQFTIPHHSLLSSESNFLTSGKERRWVRVALKFTENQQNGVKIGENDHIRRNHSSSTQRRYFRDILTQYCQSRRQQLNVKFLNFVNLTSQQGGLHETPEAYSPLVNNASGDSCVHSVSQMLAFVYEYLVTCKEDVHDLFEVRRSEKMRKFVPPPRDVSSSNGALEFDAENGISEKDEMDIVKHLLNPFLCGNEQTCEMSKSTTKLTDDILASICEDALKHLKERIEDVITHETDVVDILQVSNVLNQYISLASNSSPLFNKLFSDQSKNKLSAQLSNVDCRTRFFEILNAKLKIFNGTVDKENLTPSVGGGGDDVTEQRTEQDLQELLHIVVRLTPVLLASPILNGDVGSTNPTLGLTFSPKDVFNKILKCIYDNTLSDSRRLNSIDFDCYILNTFTHVIDVLTGTSKDLENHTEYLSQIRQQIDLHVDTLVPEQSSKFLHHLNSQDLLLVSSNLHQLSEIDLKIFIAKIDAFLISYDDLVFTQVFEIQSRFHRQNVLRRSLDVVIQMYKHVYDQLQGEESSLLKSFMSKKPEQVERLLKNTVL